MWLHDIRTRFVKDRLQETAWEDREYVYELLLIEILHRTGRLGWAAHMSGTPQKLYRAHPGESECIRLEIKEGRYVDPETFHRERDRLAGAWIDRQKDQERARRLTEAAENCARKQEEERERRRERERWISMGGGS